jgi:hypothetical protein
MELNATEEVRLEIKFVAYAYEVDRVVQWLRLHHAAFDKPFPDRRVHNVYFDSYEYDAYGENLSGISRRVKVRYRWYGEEPYPDVGVLEIKCKRNKYGWKHRFPVTDSPLQSGKRWRDIRKSITGVLPARGKICLDTYPLPVILNHYDRQYFESRDESVRVTIDTGMKVYDQRYKSVPNVTRRANISDLMIIEFKAEPAAQDQVNRAVQTLPIRVNRHSKYTTGVEAIYGY